MCRLLIYLQSETQVGGPNQTFSPNSTLDVSEVPYSVLAPTVRMLACMPGGGVVVALGQPVSYPYSCSVNNVSIALVNVSADGNAACMCAYCANSHSTG